MCFKLFSDEPDLSSNAVNMYNYDELIGITKEELKDKFGFSYNDMHSNVWMFYLTPDFKLFRNNYLYVIFKNEKVTKFALKTFRTKKFYKIYDNL